LVRSQAGVLSSSWGWPAVLYGETALLAHGVRPTWQGHGGRPPRLRRPVASLPAADAAGARRPRRLLHRTHRGRRARAGCRRVPETAIDTGSGARLPPGGTPAPRARTRGPALSGSATVYRDARYDRFGVVVELDGRVGHEWTAERWDDLDRDLDAGADGTLSLRMGWRHVNSTGASRSAIRLGRVLRSRGRQGNVRPCGPTCPVTAFGGRSPAPGAGMFPP